MLTFFFGWLVGILICIPIGPINVWIINTHIKKNATQAMAIALGDALMNFTYFFILLSGLALIVIPPHFVFVLKIVGVVLILGLGIKEIMSEKVEVGQKEVVNDTKTFFRSFSLGVFLYVSNPTLVVTMTAVAAFVKGLHVFQPVLLDHIIVSIGLGIGSLSWFTFLIYWVDRYQEKIRNQYMVYFTKGTGILMVGLACFMIYKLYSHS